MFLWCLKSHRHSIYAIEIINQGSIRYSGIALIFQINMWNSTCLQFPIFTIWFFFLICVNIMKWLNHLLHIPYAHTLLGKLKLRLFLSYFYRSFITLHHNHCTISNLFFWKYIFLFFSTYLENIRSKKDLIDDTEIHINESLLIISEISKLDLWKVKKKNQRM